jgi:hypothetical protein
MSIHSWDPVHWPTRTIIAQTPVVIEELARKSAGTAAAYRLVLGRCLLAIDENRIYESLGLSSSIHYAIQALGLSRREAYETRRVAFALESLPLLREAAESGQVSWSKLREVTRKATPDTEEIWLKLCAHRNYHEIERLCLATEYGKLPWDEGAEAEPPVTRLQLYLDAARGELFAQLALAVSDKVGRTLSVVEAIEHLAVQELAGRPATPRRVKSMRKEAERSAQARRRQHLLLVQSARELSGEGRALEGADPLSVALGLEQMGEAIADVVPVARGHEVEESSAVPARGHEVEGSSAVPARGHEVEGGAAVPARGSEQALELVEFGSERFEALHGQGQVEEKFDWQNRRLTFNPRARKPTVAQRREILRRDGYCCRTPGCPHRMWLHLHHRVYFSQHGETVRSNLVPLCSRCHSNVHKGLLRISGNADGTLSFTTAEGVSLEDAHLLDVADWLNFWLGWTGDEGDRHQPPDLSAA